MIIFVGIIGVFYSSSFDSSIKYLFLTPSYLNDTNFNWTTSVWVGILGIHGTIAALSITFMGMFVSQVSEYSNYGFKDICKSLLLRQSHFLSFSLNSVFSLLSGIMLLAFGGGLVAYIISVIVSLCFIFSYGLMYLRLYSITEKPIIINDYLFMELKSAGENYYLFNINQQNIIRKFQECCDRLSHVNSGWEPHFLSKERRVLKIFTGKEHAIILSGFCAICLEDINNEIRNNIDGIDVKLNLNLKFNQNISYSSFNIEFKKDTTIKDEFIDKIEKMLTKALFIKNIFPDEIIIYRNYEKAVINNIRSSLLKGDEWELDFGIQALFTLTDKNDIAKTMNALEHSFSYNNKKNNIDYSIFAAFFEKVSSEIMVRGNVKEIRKITGGIIDLGRYLYTVDHFYEFYTLISHSLHSYLRYDFGDDDHSLFDLYVYTMRQNLLYQNYKSFELNTNFLTKEFRYIEHAGDGESLSILENKMVHCVKNIITLILIRLDYICSKKCEDNNEIINLCSYLKSWLNAAFFEDIYYKEGTYDALFIITRDLDFDASRILREIPDYQISSVSIGNDSYKAISLIMTQSLINKNSLNPIFIRDKKDFLEKTGITISQLQAIISYLRGKHFTELLEMIGENNHDESNKEEIAEYLEKIVVEKNNMIIDFISCSELDNELVQKYINEVSVFLNRHLNKILNTEILPVADFSSSDILYSFINKREVMKSIDGVHYVMNGAYHAKFSIYQWIKNVLDKVKKINIIEIGNLQELPTNRLVTIQFMTKDESSVYRYSKGLKMKDEEGVLCLGGAGLYYMDFENEFLFAKSQSLFEVLIEKISKENIELMVGEKFLGGENPLLYARLAVVINLELIKKESYTFYFLSVDNCKKLTALHENSARLTSDKNMFLTNSKSIS